MCKKATENEGKILRSERKHLRVCSTKNSGNHFQGRNFYEMDVESCVSNVVTAAGGVFDAEGEATELAGVYEVHNGDDLAGESAEGDGSGSASSPSASRQNSQAADPYGDNPMKRKENSF